ncbi:GAS2-like protein 2B [Esox lucius]|uniref:GAS2-like protein 2B n=1 Tax=Esox lucius TaxID=8010 RepID=UPI0014768D30|nr:GAS2-like protein 2B [Esox lucius]
MLELSNYYILLTMSTGIHHASNQSIKPFKSSEEYLYAMKEDLAEWLRDLYDVDIDVNNIVESLETGAMLCSHANNVTRVAGEFIQKYGMVRQVPLPTSGVSFVNSAQPSTFLARDNVSNFITWCRKQMDIKDVLMFETDDLVLRKNEKNFVLCLLEVARRASRFGMAAPVLIQLEQEIEEEIREGLEPPPEETPPDAKHQRHTSNTQNLDEMVQHLISQCTCPTQFPMVKLSEGKYRVGDSSTLIFVRILRNHVMVRVGGGWDTLEHYLDKHDPCRCTSITHRFAQHSGTPVHQIQSRLPGRPDGQSPTTPSMLLLSRHAPTPLQPVLWATYSPGVLRTAWTRASLPPDRGASKETSPSRLRLSASTPTLQHHQSEDELTHNSSTRTGREATRSSPAPRQTSSLPRSIPRSSTPQPQPKAKPQPQRPKTPLVFHRSTGQQCTLAQPQTETKPPQSWTKSQFASKLRQRSALGSNTTESPTGTSPQRNGGLNMVRTSFPIRSHSPASYTPVRPGTPTITIQQPKGSDTLQRRPDRVNTIRPSKTCLDGPQFEPGVRPFTPAGGNKRRDSNKSPAPYDIITNPLNSSITGDFNQEMVQRLMRQSAFGFTLSDKASHKITEGSLGEPGHPQLGSTVIGAGDRPLFSPPPISPVQEACLYRSLEQEILSNLQQLRFNSDGIPSLPDNRKCDKSTRHQPSENALEKDHSVFTRVPAGSEQSPHTSASNCAQQGEASFDAVISELSKGKRLLEKVCVESWANTLPGSSNDRQTYSCSDVEDFSLSLTKPCVSQPWSSWSASVKSKELLADCTTAPDSENGVINSVRQSRTELTNSPSVDLRVNNAVGPDSLWKPRNGSFRQKGTLKKPERVPSIYKLKLWPKVRPRDDYRPGKKPSRIPTPISYRGSHPAEDPQESRKDTHTQASHQHTSSRHPDRQGTIVTSQSYWQRDHKATVGPRLFQTPKQEIAESIEESWV